MESNSNNNQSTANGSQNSQRKLKLKPPKPNDAYFTSKQEIDSQSTNVSNSTQTKTPSPGSLFDGVVDISDRTVFLHRGSVQKEIPVPPTYEELCAEAAKQFDLKQVEFFDLNSFPVTSENFSKVKEGEISRVMVFDVSEGGKLLSIQEWQVDITPSKNILLKAGTSEYDLPSAIAELVDNSIQAVRNSKNKKIQIRIKTDGKKKCFVWDNGRGMASYELKDWATMGVSQSDVQQDQKPGTSSNFSHRGFISRYGVGAKRAAFYLGSRVTVSTKSVTCNWVNETTLSADSLSESESWQTTLTQRNPINKETQHPSFTLIQIQNLNFEPSQANLDAAVLKLAHMYFYYTHSKKSIEELHENANNVQNEQDNNNEDGVNPPPAKKKKSKSKLQTESPDAPQDEEVYEIKFNGMKLSDQTGDMESQYIRLGKNPKDFDFTVQLPNNRRSQVKLRLYYFPFEEGGETMPIPHSVLIEHQNSKEEIPLLLRKPGIEVFWNERLIPEAHFSLLDGFGFTSMGKVKNKSLEEKWFHRVKGMLFLNSDFPVTHNKMHILKDDAAFVALKETSDRGMQTAFRDWLYNCHITYDQEIQYLGEHYDSKENKTVCDGIKRGKDTIRRNDYVQIKHGHKYVAARVESIFYKGEKESKLSEGYGVFQVASSLKERAAPPVELPLARIKKPLTPEEYKGFLQDEQNKLPGKIKLFDGDKVELPPDQIVAGEKLKWVSVALYDKSRPGKLVEKVVLDELNIKVHFSIEKDGTKGVLMQQETSQCYKTSKYSFNNLDCFKTAGVYRLKFSVNAEGVEPIVHVITVLPGAAESVIAHFNGDEPSLPNETASQSQMSAYPLGAPLPPIFVKQVDKSCNVVPWGSEDEIVQALNNVTLAAYHAESKAQLKLAEEPNKTIEQGVLRITNVVLATIKLDKPQEGVLIQFSDVPGSANPVVLRFNVMAGNPASLDFEGNPFAGTFRKGSTLPAIKATVRDEAGNLANHLEKCYLQVSSPALKKPAKGEIRDGVGLVEGKRLKLVAFANTISVAIVDKQGSQLLQQVIPLAMESSDAPHTLQLVPGNNLTIESENPLKLSAVVGVLVEFCTIHLVLENGQHSSFASLIAEDAILTSNWLEGEFHIKDLLGDSPDEEKSALVLPPFESEEARNVPSFIEIKSASTKITLNFVMTMKAGPIYAFDVVTPGFDSVRLGNRLELGVNVVDKFNNVIYNFDEEQEAMLSALQPNLNIEKARLLELEERIIINLVQTRQEMESMQGTPPTKKKKSNSTSNASTPGKRASQRSSGEAAVFSASLIIGGPKPTEPVTFVISDPQNKIKSGKRTLHLIEGQAAQLRVKKQQKYAVTVDQGESIADFMVSATDKYGNLASINNVVLKITGEPSIPLQFAKHKNNKQQSKFSLTEGVVNIPCTVSGEPGNYTIKISSESVALEPCTVEMTVKPDTVVPAQIEIVSQGNCAKVLAGSALNGIRVRVVTQSGVPVEHNPTVDSMILRWGDKEYKPEYDQETQTFAFDKIPGDTQEGNKTAKLRFSRSGTSISLTQDLPATVVPGPPCQLSSTQPSNVIYERHKKLFDSWTVYVTDQYGNVCRDFSGAVVELSVIKSTMAVEQEPVVLPNLVGELTAQVTNGEAIFSSISFSNARAEPDFYALLVAQKKDPKKKPKFELKPFVMDFCFQSGDAQDYKQQLQARKLQLTQDMNTLKTEQQSIDQKLKSLKADAEDIQTENAQLVDQLKQFVPADDLSQYTEKDKETLNQIIQTLQQGVSSADPTQTRTAVYKTNSVMDQIMNIFQSQGEEKSGIVGVVAELGHVQDEAEAKALAKYCGSKFSTIVFANTKAMEKYRAKFRSSELPLYFVSLDQITPYVSKKELQNSNSNNNATKELPLDTYPNAPLEGFIGFAVNRIQLKRKHEHLRRTLFYSLFGTSLVFLTVPQAQEYRKYVVSKKGICPTIITLEGEVIESAGFMAVGGRKDVSLSFGALPLQESSDYQHVGHVISILQKIATNLDRVEQIEVERKAEISKCEKRKKDIKSKLQQLKAELDTVENEMNSMATPQANKRKEVTSKEDKQKSKKAKPANSNNVSTTYFEEQEEDELLMPSQMFQITPPSSPATKANGSDKKKKLNGQKGSNMNFQFNSQPVMDDIEEDEEPIKLKKKQKK